MRLTRQHVCFSKFTRQWVIALFLVALVFLFINLLPRNYAKRIKLTDNDNASNLKKIIKNNDNTIKVGTLKDDPCELIHIGIVCSGYNANLNLHSLLKSIYFYRVNPIHFHIVTSKSSINILQTLFDSWNVPQVNVTFYDMNENLDDVKWIPNFHYSGIYGLLKLTFPKIIPLHITKEILVLDTDITLVSDIYELWKIFRKFKKTQAIGIIENQSDYYLGQNTWPAIKRGFNSGVVMYKLELLKQLEWSKLWSNLTKDAIRVHGSTQLADQDILNLVIKEHPDLLYEVPCGWNTQLSDHTNSYNCYKYSKVKIVHWNSPKKYNVENRDGEYFRSLLMGIEDYNGNLFRKKLQYCDKTASSISMDTYEVCSEFYNLPESHWRTLLYFWEYTYTSVDKDDVTFVAQLSYDRLHQTEELVKYWSGPISFTVYVSDHEFADTIAFIRNSDILNNRLNVAYHAVFKEGVYYPINTLRNIGLKNVQTPFVFLADVDFVPSQNLYEQLRDYISSLRSMKKKALVIPAFEIKNPSKSVPKDKMELLSKLANKTVFPFLSNVWASGHVATDYEKWKLALEPYKVKWKPDYEPYIVVARNVVQYDERFVGFGWNKVSHIMELEAQNYEFIVLPDVFVVHKPHAPSYDIARFRKSPTYRRCLQKLKEEFIQKLNKKYNRFFVNPISPVILKDDYIRRRKRNYNPLDHSTVETNTDYPSNME